MYVCMYVGHKYSHESESYDSPILRFSDSDADLGMYVEKARRFVRLCKLRVSE